jgi:cytochrome c peroxidase
MARSWRGATSSSLLVAALLIGAASPLPEGSRIDPEPADFPTQLLASEQAGGRQSFLVALGNTAFSSPLLYGARAREAGLSCNSCHVNGHINRSFFIPGHSNKPGSFDATSAAFNPRADNGVADALDIPSLRGVRLTGPWGRDGRIGSLREFARHVIVDEFAGPEPAPLILDALAAYLNEQQFLPNPRIDGSGRLAANASDSERRGEHLFEKPFAGMGNQACASCHLPSALFTDGRVHDVGTGGVFKTPTLVNSGDSAPYFHDGRAASFADVVTHFDTRFGLGLSAQDRADLAAYLGAIGDAEEPTEAPGFSREMGELAIWTELMATTIGDHDARLTRFVAETVAADLTRLSRAWPDGDALHARRRPDRTRRTVDFPALQAAIMRVADLADTGQTDQALAALEAYADLAESMAANYPRRAQAGAAR